jgi:hypothetical protein
MWKWLTRLGLRLFEDGILESSGRQSKVSGLVG